MQVKQFQKIENCVIMIMVKRMQTRMEKYHDNYEPVSRAKMNQNLYNTLYDETEYSSVEGVAEIPNTREIDIQKIREMLKDKTYKAPIIERVDETTREEKNYDLNDILNKAKDSQSDQDRHHSLSLTQVDLLKPSETKEDTNLENLISSITNTSMLNKLGDKDLSLDMFSDLKSENTVINKSVKDYIEEAKKEDHTSEIDRSFFTQSLGLKSEDFEELKDINKSLKKNNILVKVLLFIVAIVFITAAMFLIYTLLR